MGTEMIDLSWLDVGGKKKVEGHMQTGDDVRDFWLRVREITGFRSIMEIGFNAGHSSAFLLELFPDVTVVSHDIGWHKYTVPNSEKVKQRYGDRFEFVQIDSLQIKPRHLQGRFDVMFIDGNHDTDWIDSDLRVWMQTDIPYAVVDDLQVKTVNTVYKKYLPHYQELHRGQYHSNTGSSVTAALIQAR